MTEIITIGSWLKRARRQLNLTQKELAYHCGCSVGTIRKIEADERKPSRQLARLMAENLNVPPEKQSEFIAFARSEPHIDNLSFPTLTPAAEMSLADALTPAAEGEKPRHNLPRHTTPFFGRRRELAEIAAQLGDPQCRLLTILAYGGMGKTRLGIEAAAAQIGNFTDGVTYVALASVSPTASNEAASPLLGALVDALNFSFYGRDRPEQQLFRHLRSKEMLLVLDNFEHLLDSAVFISDLLQNAPDIKILITSRERLNLQEEWLFVLHGLSSKEAANSDAVRLFSQRAKQVQSSFDLEVEFDEVLRICRLVEGMPLALELAAAWVLQLSCAEIAEEIAAEIDFLTTRARNVPERQRSMRAVFDTSWERLSLQERDILQKASVFRGGFDRRAAEVVTGDSLYTLSDLVSKSFLSVSKNGRYAVHELLRQFAAEKLAEHGSLVQEVEANHGRYFFGLLTAGDLNEPTIAPEVSHNSDNVRAAVRWTVRHEPHSFDESMIGALVDFFVSNGGFSELETTFHLIIDQLLPDCIDPQIPDNMDVKKSCVRVATFQLFLGFSLWQQNRLQEAEESVQLAMEWLPVGDDIDIQALRAESMGQLGTIKSNQGAFVQALSLYQQAGDLYQAVDDQYGYCWNLHTRNIIMQNTGEFDAAEELQNSLQQIAAQMDFPEFAEMKWNELGKLATIRGQLDEAEAYFDKSLEQFPDLTNYVLLSFVLRERGELSRLQGEYAEAKNYAQRSIATAEDINMPLPIVQSLWLMGNVAVDEGHFETALHYFAEYDQISTPLQEQIGGPGWALLGLGRLEEAREQFTTTLQKMVDNLARPIGLDALVGMAHIKARTGQLEETLAILALVQNHRSSHFESREKARRLRQELTAELSSKLISEAESKAREMDLMQTAESLLADAEETV